MVVLSEVERTGRGDLGGDRTETGLVQDCLEGVPATLRRGTLLVRERVDRRTVLGADVVTLAHPLRRVVRLPEDLQQVLEAHHRRVEHDRNSLGVPGQARTRLLIGRVRGDPARVPDRGRVHPGDLPERPLRTPETAEPEHRGLETRGDGTPQRCAEDRVPIRYRKRRFRTAGQCLRGRGQRRLVASEEHVEHLRDP